MACLPCLGGGSLRMPSHACRYLLRPNHNKQTLRLRTERDVQGRRRRGCCWHMAGTGTSGVNMPEAVYAHAQQRMKCVMPTECRLVRSSCP